MPDNELYIVLYEHLHQLPFATTLISGVPSTSTFPDKIARSGFSLAASSIALDAAMSYPLQTTIVN